MSGGIRRGLADLAGRALQATLPPSLQSWGWAVRCEAANIEDDTKALLFTLDSICGLMPRAVASRLAQPLASLTGDSATFSKGSVTMTILNAAVRRPRALGIACATGAVILGLAYMALAGAPMRYLAINSAALGIGLTMLALVGRIGAAARQWASGAIVATAGTLLATAFFGSNADGVTRWVHVGGFALQPSLILLPAMIVSFARTRSVWTTAYMVVAASAMALQPDRAMAGMLVLGLAALAVICRDRHSVVALLAGVTGFAVAFARRDATPAVPYVDQILYTSFDVHLGAGLAVIGGAALLLVPAIVGWHRDSGNRATYAVFGAVWFAAIIAAALGNYPTPIVGYGGSAIIGYALSLVVLPRLVEASASAVSRTGNEAGGTLPDRHLLVGMA
jgi:hypothetical protein